jgi:hypothetical protein
VLFLEHSRISVANVKAVRARARVCIYIPHDMGLIWEGREIHTLK